MKMGQQIRLTLAIALAIPLFVWGAGEVANLSEGTGTAKFNQTGRTGDIELEIDDLRAHDDLVVGDTLTVSGAVTLASSITAEHLKSTDDASIADDLWVGGDTVITGDLSVVGIITNAEWNGGNIASVYLVTNTPASGQVLHTDGTNGYFADAVAAAAQTPWTNNVDAATYNLTDLGDLEGEGHIEMGTNITIGANVACYAVIGHNDAIGNNCTNIFVQGDDHEVGTNCYDITIMGADIDIWSNCFNVVAQGNNHEIRNGVSFMYLLGDSFTVQKDVDNCFGAGDTITFYDGTDWSVGLGRSLTVRGRQNYAIGYNHTFDSGCQDTILIGDTCTADSSDNSAAIGNTCDLDANHQYMLGRRAHGNGMIGAFAYGDSQNADYNANAKDSFNVRAQGGWYDDTTLIVSNGVVQIGVDDLTNSVTSTPSEGDILRYDGSNWTNTSGFVDRGDPSAFDYTTNTLTLDNAYNSMDLSSVVPAGAVSVMLRVQISDDAAGRSLALKHPDNDNGYNAIAVRNHVAGVTAEEQVIVSCDSGRIIEYKIADDDNITVNIVIMGWYF